MSKAERVAFRAAAFGLMVAGLLLRAGGTSPVRVNELVFGIGLGILSLVSLPAGERGGKNERAKQKGKAR
jgi:hypothetical protein